MNTSTNRLDGPRLKVLWAAKHIRHLDGMVKHFCEANRNVFRVEDDLQAGEKVYCVDFRTPIPYDIPLIIGDVIHNLRSSLDHLAWQLVEANGGTPTKQTYFPIYSDAARFQAESVRKLHGMSAAVVKLIEAVQPYHSAYQNLRALSDLDNWDKHRLLLERVFKVCFVEPVFVT